MEGIRSKKKKRNRIFLVVCGFLFGLFYWNCLPYPLFEEDTSTVLNDKNGALIGARIAKDEQWRFPHNSQVPKKFEKCIITFEDKEFYNHFGVRLFSIFRAIKQNIEAQRVVSGASTLSMQVIRLARKVKQRSYLEKTIEMLMATRLEISYSKDEILAFYTSNAPFGGNIVGLDAASWRYYGRASDQLSWAESATLAVLPNAPGLIFPGKNQLRLKQKRDRLLKALFDEGIIDATDLKLAVLEPLPTQTYRIPNNGLHLLNKAINDGHSGDRVQSTLDLNQQSKIESILSLHYDRLKKMVFTIPVLLLWI